MAALQFSVVIPTCRRHDLLARCLESLRPGVQLADPASYEVIVTDDARAGTAEEMMRAQFPWARWVQGPAQGPAANRNNGGRHAIGNWICFIDDDCHASPEWLAALGEVATDESLALLEGKTTVPDPKDDPFLHAVSNSQGGAYWSCNLAVRRDRFLAVGGFDEDFLEPAAEDMEFAYHCRAHHFGSRFCPKAVVYHPVRRIGWRGIWKRLLMSRWTVMYDYKVDKDLRVSDPPLKNLSRAFVTVVVTHLRTTWYDLRDWKLSYWRTRNFWLAVRWITFPFYLPYYLYWVYRFQQQLNGKARAVEA